MNNVCKAIPIIAVITCIGLGNIDSNKNIVGKSENTNPLISRTSTPNTYITTTVKYENNETTTTTTKSAELQLLNSGEYDECANWQKITNYLPCLESDNLIYIDSDIQNYIMLVSNEFGVPYELSLAICYMESRFDPYVDNAGLNTDGSIDYGMMGLNSTYLQNSCDIYNNGNMINPYNPYENIYIGIQILAYNYNYFYGSIYDTANAYNLGIGGWEYMKDMGEYWYYGQDVIDYINLLYTYAY